MSTPDSRDRSTENEKKQQSAKSSADPLTVLVVDDDVLTQKLMSVLLTQAGHIAETASGGAEAIELLKSRKFDLVLLDIHMPIIDGFEACRQIRAWEDERQHTPIVALTAYDAPGEGEKCLAAGMDDYAFKPLGQNHLARILASCASGKYQPSPLEPRPINLTDTSERPILDVESALPYVGNDKEIYKELLGEFVKSLPEKLAKMHNDLGSEKWQEILSETHGLKGKSTALGAARLAGLIVEIEQQIREGQAHLAKETFQKIDNCVQLLQSNAYEFLNNSK